MQQFDIYDINKILQILSDFFIRLCVYFSKCGIIEENFPDWRFENIKIRPSGEFHAPMFDYFWENLTSLGIKELDDDILFFKKWNDSMSEFLDFSKESDFEILAEYLPISNKHYVFISKASFHKIYESNWSEAIIAIINTIFGQSQEEGMADQLKIRRNIYLFALWFQYAKSHKEETVDFLFDSIQNTSFISVQGAAPTKSPNEKIRSLFMSCEEGKMIDLFWDDNSWNPISSGIILSN